MKKHYLEIFMVVLIGIMLNGCAKQPVHLQYAVCPVCNRTVDKDDAYTGTYKGTKYYFDKASCKQIFKKKSKTYAARKNNMTK